MNLPFSVILLLSLAILRPVSAQPTTSTVVSDTSSTTSTAGAPASKPATPPTLVSTPAPTNPTLSFGTGFGQEAWLTDGARQSDFAEPENLEHVPALNYSDYKSSFPANGRPQPVYRPVGSLTDKTVYAMAGHGWTYGEERMSYSTQRNLTHGVVEDFGNGDQMHIFAHMAWNCGATVVPLRPIDHQENERIVDTAAPQTRHFGTWYKGTSDRFYGEDRFQPRYLVSRAERQETAVAQFRPYIPEDGYYPVYTWARTGTDRVNQTYRIYHAGGAAQVEVDHRKNGNAWIWLGSYYFQKGTSGRVEISNAVRDPYSADGKHYVVADAIRFGNGRGDVLRPGGISGRAREDEGDIYWIQESLGQGVDARFYRSRLDRTATISSPPRVAALLNFEGHDDFFDRILISFHSNASTGKARGAVALVNKDPAQEPEYQQSLADEIGTELNRLMVARSPFSDQEWQTRERGTYSASFGELRREYLQNEMSATIVETAFHDNAADAEILQNGMARILMAQATIKGIFSWLQKVDPSFGLAQMPPASPQALSFRIQSNTRATLSWFPGESGPDHGGEPLAYRVSISRDGRGFDGGTLVATGTSFTIPLRDGRDVVAARVAAINRAGESLPSQLVVVGKPANWKSSTRRALVITGTMPLDGSDNIPQELGDVPNASFANSAVTQRVRPLLTSQVPRGLDEAAHFAAVGLSVESCQCELLDESALNLDRYAMVIWPTGAIDPNSPVVPMGWQRALAGYVRRGGNLFMSGSQIVTNLARHGTESRRFLESTLCLEQDTTQTATNRLTSSSNRFLPMETTLTLSNISEHYYELKTVDVLTPQGKRAIPILYFGSGPDDFAGVLARPAGAAGQVVVLGVPLGSVAKTEGREAIARGIVKQLIN